MSIQNVDDKIGFTITSNGVAIPLSSLNDYAITIYKVCSDKKEYIATYLKSNVGTYSITPDNATTNRCTIVINRQLTRSTIPGDLYAELFIQATAGSDFIGLKQNRGVNGIFIMPLDSAANPNVLM